MPGCRVGLRRSVPTYGKRQRIIGASRSCTIQIHILFYCLVTYCIDCNVNFIKLRLYCNVVCLCGVISTGYCTDATDGHIWHGPLGDSKQCFLCTHMLSSCMFSIISSSTSNSYALIMFILYLWLAVVILVTGSCCRCRHPCYCCHNNFCRMNKGCGCRGSGVYQDVSFLSSC